MKRDEIQHLNLWSIKTLHTEPPINQVKGYRKFLKKPKCEEKRKKSVERVLCVCAHCNEMASPLQRYFMLAFKMIDSAQCDQQLSPTLMRVMIISIHFDGR